MPAGCIAKEAVLDIMLKTMQLEAKVALNPWPEHVGWIELRSTIDPTKKLVYDYGLSGQWSVFKDKMSAYDALCSKIEKYWLTDDMLKFNIYDPGKCFHNPFYGCRSNEEIMVIIDFL